MRFVRLSACLAVLLALLQGCSSIEPTSTIASMSLPVSLADVLPDSILDERIAKNVRQGQEIPRDELDAFYSRTLHEVGKTPADMVLAIGAGSLGSTVTALQVRGVDARQMIQPFLRDAFGSVGSSQVMVAGKPTTVLDPLPAAGQKVYLYAHGDVLFVVATASHDAAVDAISQLP